MKRFRVYPTDDGYRWELKDGDKEIDKGEQAYELESQAVMMAHKVSEDIGEETPIDIEAEDGSVVHGDGSDAPDPDAPSMGNV